MRAFFTTLTLTSAAVAGFWYYQHRIIAGLHESLAATPGPVAAPGSAGKLPETKPVSMLKAPEALLRNADGSPVVTSRNDLRGILEAVRHVRTLDRKAIEKLLDGDGPDDFGESMGIMLAGWARLGEMDPRGALTLALATHKKAIESGADGHETREEGFYIVLHDWLIRDRAAALAWFHEQPDSEHKANFLGVAGFILAASDPELLSQLTGSIQDPELQEKSLLQSIVSQSATDPGGALARFSELKDPQSRANALQFIDSMAGATHTRQLLELTLPLAVDGTVPGYRLGGLLRDDIAKDPALALEWISHRSTAELNALRTGSSIVLHRLGTLDAAKVQAVVSTFEKPEDREWIMAGYYAGAGGTNPLPALQALSTSVQNASLRADAVSTILSSAVANSREAEVEPWIAAQPEKDQAALRIQIATWKANRERETPPAPSDSTSPPAATLRPRSGSSGTSPPPPPRPQPPAPPSPTGK